MRIVIAGGGIAAAYLANAIAERAPQHEVLIVTDEAQPPYDRIHLCGKVDPMRCGIPIAIELASSVRLALSSPVSSIDPAAKRIFSPHASYAYDILVIATGSRPKTLFDIAGISNASTFRSLQDCRTIGEGIEGKNVVIVGGGPIALELADTLMRHPGPRTISLLVRGETLYDKALNPSAAALIRSIYESDPRVTVAMNDEIVDTVREGDRIAHVVTRHRRIDDPFVIFGIGIEPNIAFARPVLECGRGILVDSSMRTGDTSIYCIGEAAQMRDGGFVAGRVKECTLQADAALASILGEAHPGFVRGVAVDGLKVGSFLLADVTSPAYRADDPANETILIAHDERIDQYIVGGDRLRRFIGINTNIDLLYLRRLIEDDVPIDAAWLYANREASAKGRLVCSCESVYYDDLVRLIRENGIASFADLGRVSRAGRICGRCRGDVCAIIAATAVDPAEARRLREERERAAGEARLAAVKARLDKYNALHPLNRISEENFDAALASYDMAHDFNRWVSMVTATMRLEPEFEEAVGQGLRQLPKIPVLWLELADCSGNSEGFIKSSHPTVDELILKFVSLDYHELLMAPAGQAADLSLDDVVAGDAGRYILIVEGAVPLGMEGKFLRIGAKGETGIDLLRRVAAGAAAVIAVGSCAYDGGVVAASPNPTGAVGVAEALGRRDIIQLPGCPVNPVNIVGTLLHYIMFEEFPKLDEKNRPLWAYGYRIHDNCERRGHYDLGEFVLEWGDEGAKKGWCLFKMGCKGPYAQLNCSLVKFNEGTSWPVQAGHGCFGCGEGKIAFDRYANNRMLEGAVHE